MSRETTTPATAERSTLAGWPPHWSRWRRTAADGRSSGASTRPHTAIAITLTCTRARRPGVARSTGPSTTERPRLVGHGQPDQHRRPCRALTRGQQHRGGAQHRAEQLLGMADLERGQRHRVGDGEEPEEPAREPAAAESAHVGDDPDTEHGAGQQARQRDESVHGQRPTAPEVGEQQKGSTQNERAAVRRDEAHEDIEVPGDQCRERGRRPRCRSRSRRTRTASANPPRRSPPSATQMAKPFSRRRTRIPRISVHGAGP